MRRPCAFATGLGGARETGYQPVGRPLDRGDRWPKSAKKPWPLSMASRPKRSGSRPPAATAHGLADLGRRPAAGPVPRRLRLVDALDPQRAAVGARVHRRRPRPAGARRVGDPARAAHRRGAGADRRRRPRHRAAAARAAAPRRVLVRRGAGRPCRGPARRAGARLYRRRLERARPRPPADRSPAGPGRCARPRRRSPSTATISAR